MSGDRVHAPLNVEEADLARRLHALPTGSPSVRVDTAILAASRAPRLARPRPRWIAGFAAAASLVLVVGLVWRMQPERRPTAATMPPAALREAEPSAPPAPTAPAAGALSDRAGGMLQRARADAGSTVTEAPRQPAAPAREIAAKAPAATALEPLPHVTVTGARLATPATADAKAAQAPGKANAAPPAVFEDAAPMAIEAPPPAPLAPPASMREPRHELGAPAAAPETVRGSTNASADASADATLNDEIEAIRHLQREGRQDVARRRLRALIERHPQWTVPDDLRGLLE